MTAADKLAGAPPAVLALPRNKAGYPVPRFVAWIDGLPDFRVMDGQFRADAHRFSLCWVCGLRRGRFATFVVGPMCAVNRVSAEPPSHRACAQYAAQQCPFLANPLMVRRERGLEVGHHTPGVMITRNPGVALLWTTKAYRPVTDGKIGFLFDIGEPHDVRWLCEGRDATRPEVVASITSGLPALQESAGAQGPHALAALTAALDTAMGLVPA